MPYDPKVHHRRSIRYWGFDYASAGAYFVTVCTAQRRCILTDPRIRQIVETEWLHTARMRPDVLLDEFVVMPNHLHGIVFITSGDARLRDDEGVCNTPLQPRFRSPGRTLGAIIRGFKSATTRQINTLFKTPRHPVWQRNYYEHIIRDDEELNDTRQYIVNNPLTWDTDDENPDRISR